MLVVRIRNSMVAVSRARGGNATARLRITYEKVSIAVTYILRTVNFYTSWSASKFTRFASVYPLNSYQQNTKHFLF